MPGKTEGKRRRGWQKIRRLDGITDSRDMNLGGLQEMVRDRDAWLSVVLGVTKSDNYHREGVQPHPSADNWIKALLSKSLPTEQDPVIPITSPSHQEADISLLASSIRGQTEETRSTVSQ